MKRYLLRSILYVKPGEESASVEKGSPHQGALLEAQSDYWFRLTAGPVAPQHRRYFGFLQPDVRKKESLACFPDQAVLLPTTCGIESRPMPEIRIGTSAFTAAGWEGSFYPTGMTSDAAGEIVPLRLADSEMPASSLMWEDPRFFSPLFLPNDSACRGRTGRCHRIPKLRH